ncbi:hypothetical protein LINPERPRIM_LOCUS28300 [Linum perenne]
MAVAAAIGGVLVAGGEDGGADGSDASRSPSREREVRVRAEDDRTDGASRPERARLEAEIRNAVQLHRILCMEAGFHGDVSRVTHLESCTRIFTVYIVLYYRSQLRGVSSVEHCRGGRPLRRQRDS